MKVLNWMIVFCGLWEAGDIAAVFVPGFGEIPAPVWNHIIVGVLLVIVGTWAALTRQASTARIMNWTAAAAGVWLVIASFVLRSPLTGPGLWNDVIVGLVVFVLGLWAAFRWLL